MERYAPPTFWVPGRLATDESGNEALGDGSERRLVSSEESRSLASADEAGLVGALQRGDESAFLDLVARYHRPLVQLAAVYVPSNAIAEEVVQDTWIAVIKGIDRFEARSSLRTWIFRIATYQAKTRGQRERRSVPLSSLLERDALGAEPSVDPSRFLDATDPRSPGHWAEPPTGWASDGERRMLERETQEVVRGALDLLPASQRLVMTLRDIEGWSSDEVCATLEISPGNQRVLLHRARSRVRAALEAYFRQAAAV